MRIARFCLAAATLAAIDGSPPDSMSPAEAIVYASKRDGTWQIYRMNPDGTDETRLTDRRMQARFPSVVA
jgi:Tol biopolymer transport system component